MSFRKLKYIYHDAELVSFSIDQNQEIELHIKLVRRWNESMEIACVRFGAIVNFEEVKRFFDGLSFQTDKHAYLATILGLQYTTQKPYTIMIDLANYGSISINARQVTEL